MDQKWPYVLSDDIQNWGVTLLCVGTPNQKSYSNVWPPYIGISQRRSETGNSVTWQPLYFGTNFRFSYWRDNPNFTILKFKTWTILPWKVQNLTSTFIVTFSVVGGGDKESWITQNASEARYYASNLWRKQMIRYQELNVSHTSRLETCPVLGTRVSDYSYLWVIKLFLASLHLHLPRSLASLRRWQRCLILRQPTRSSRILNKRKKSSFEHSVPSIYYKFFLVMISKIKT